MTTFSTFSLLKSAQFLNPIALFSIPFLRRKTLTTLNVFKKLCSELSWTIATLAMTLHANFSISIVFRPGELSFVKILQLNPSKATNSIFSKTTSKPFLTILEIKKCFTYRSLPPHATTIHPYSTSVVFYRNI